MKCLNFFLGVITLIVTSCTDIDSTQVLTADKAKIVFYTNAQAILNCGEFDVNIFVDNIPVGKLSRPYLPLNTVPTIEDKTDESPGILTIQENVGQHDYHAEFDCSNYGIWEGKFEVQK